MENVTYTVKLSKHLTQMTAGKMQLERHDLQRQSATTASCLLKTLPTTREFHLLEILQEY